jgi:periplasmic protein TonB
LVSNDGLLIIILSILIRQVSFMQNWEEILFDDRNKSYGSYQLRKKYTKYLLWGFLIAILFVTIPIVIVYVQSQQTEDYSNLPYIVSVELDKPPDLESSFSPPPMEEKKEVLTHEYIPLIVDTIISQSEQKKVEKIAKSNDTDSVTMAIKGNSKKGNGFDINGDSVSFNLYVDKMPEFPGGFRALNQFLVEHLVYPSIADKQHIDGKVIVFLTITETGNVSNINIHKSSNPLFDQEAIRVTKMLPKWEPAMRKGRPVKCRYALPICFKLTITTN